MNSFEEPNIVKTIEETDKKCPACGGTMDFDPKTGGLSCPYCGHQQEIERKVEAAADESQAPSQSAAELRLEDAEKVENCDWGLATKTVICKSCGAESVYDVNEISAVCPYCGSNQVMEASDQNTMAPGGVIPFKIDQKEAGNRFLGWIKKKFFAPKAAKESAKAGKFQGIYLPYWTFDANTSSTYRAQYGIDRTVEDSDGNSTTVTDWFTTRGHYEEFIDDELVCGSSLHDERMLRELEPFNTGDNVIYKPEYVAGFGAERYSIGIKEAWQKAKDRILDHLKQMISDKIRNEHRADHVRGLEINADFKDMTYKYLLLPVWISSFKYKDKVYQFMVNGETGKVSGRSPVSVLKVILTILVVIAIIAICYMLMN